MNFFFTDYVDYFIIDSNQFNLYQKKIQIFFSNLIFTKFSLLIQQLPVVSPKIHRFLFFVDFCALTFVFVVDRLFACSLLLKEFSISKNFHLRWHKFKNNLWSFFNKLWSLMAIWDWKRTCCDTHFSRWSTLDNICWNRKRTENDGQTRSRAVRHFLSTTFFFSKSSLRNESSFSTHAFSFLISTRFDKWQQNQFCYSSYFHVKKTLITANYFFN